MVSPLLSLILLLGTALLLEVLLFPLVATFIHGPLDGERRNKAIMSIFVVLVRFLVGTCFFLWQFLCLDYNDQQYQSMVCGEMDAPNTLAPTVWFCFTIHCSFFIIESFSPRFYLKQTVWSWLHHAALGVNWGLYILFKVDDAQANALGLIYGALVSFFAWNDVLQLVRYISEDDYGMQYLCFRIYYCFKCLQFPAFIIVPGAWCIFFFCKGCLSRTAFAIMITMVIGMGLPDIFLLVTQMRAILIHYKKKAQPEGKINALSVTAVGDDSCISRETSAASCDEEIREELAV